jgi:Sigma-54 interaction domain
VPTGLEVDRWLNSETARRSATTSHTGKPGIMNTLLRSVPEDGDVVVREERREGTLVYVLHTAPGADQVLVRTRDKAVAHALAFAKRQHVRAWLTAEECDVAVLEDFRSNAWSVFRGAHPHALLIGSEASAQAVIARLLRYLRAPLVHWRPRALVEPPQPAGTLVIWEVDTLNPMQQARLLRWMDRHGAALQVVSVTPRPMFPLVLEGAFLQSLYYRLNMVCLALSSNVDVAVDASSISKRPRPTLPRERVRGRSGAAPARSS